MKKLYNTVFYAFLTGLMVSNTAYGMRGLRVPSAGSLSTQTARPATTHIPVRTLLFKAKPLAEQIKTLEEKSIRAKSHQEIGKEFLYQGLKWAAIGIPAFTLGAYGLVQEPTFIDSALLGMLTVGGAYGIAGSTIWPFMGASLYGLGSIRSRIFAKQIAEKKALQKTIEKKQTQYLKDLE